MKISISTLSRWLEGDDAYELSRWLEGDAHVKQDWIKRLSLRATRFDKPLYRLMSVPKSSNAKQGTIYKVTGQSELVSASDKINAAVYAGCQWLHDVDKDLTDSKLLLVRLIEPVVCATHKQIMDALAAYPNLGRSGHVGIRTKNEREYIVRAKNLKGVILYHTEDCQYVLNDDHKQLLKSLHK